MLRSCCFAGLLCIARGRDLSAPKGPAPAPDPDFPDDPPPDPRLASLRWGAKVGGGDASLQRMGVLTALAICLHNFPEGLITFVATVDDPTVGLALCVAIAIHNIPEGLCVSIPVYYATGDRRKAFLYAFFSGVTELLGAVLGYAVLKSVDEGEGSATAYAVVFGLVAGMMIAISLKELLPTAYRYAGADKEKYVTAWIWAGAFVMAMSLVLFVA